MPPTQTDWELIQEDPQLSDYAAAVGTRPELVQLINGDDVVTVFVPTNAAVAHASPTGTRSSLTQLPSTSSSGHTSLPAPSPPSELFAGDVPSQLRTLSGQTVFVDPAARTINGASIVTADTPGTNGIVHTIDQLFVDPRGGTDDHRDTDNDGTNDHDGRLTPTLVSCRCRFPLAGLTNPPERRSDQLGEGTFVATIDAGRSLVTHLRPNR